MSRGRLAIVGLGPGDPQLLTGMAAQELKACQLLIGYQAYLAQIPSTASAARREPYALGEELSRAQRAVEAAIEGVRVTLVSSGDPGIYGMAAIALEELANRVGVQEPPEVAVIPGVTAATAAAALVGAPLAVDFACLSLSDLLLPAAELEAKLTALAAADIVLALYNPASRTRVEPWKKAVRELQSCRPASTPVAIVERAFRPGQKVQLAQLAKLGEIAVDMETVVIVGSSRTRRRGDWLLTLRDGGGGP
jgi:precorrin-3B C17-methyltransferase